MKMSFQYAVIAGLVILAASMIANLFWSDQDLQNSALMAQAPVASGDIERRTTANYKIPAVRLINQHGVEMALPEVLSPEKFIVVDFIFTTCTTICPVLSSGLVNFQEQLGKEADKVVIVSITIDPEHDKPDVLREYSRRFNVHLDRQFLTGSREDINSVMKAFDAFTPNKMTHYPLTFMRGPGKAEWVRVMGLMSASDLVTEYRQLTEI